MAGERWYAAKAKPGQERGALERLERQSFIAYFPLMTIERAKNGRIVRESEGLFPGYVLVWFALATPSWKAINNTRGVVRLLGATSDGMTPVPIREGEIERLQQREKTGQLWLSEIIRLRRGDQVRVKLGWAVDQIGTVVRTKSERVLLLLSLLGGTVRVTAPSHALELIARASAVASGGAEALPDFITRPIVRKPQTAPVHQPRRRAAME